MKKNFLIIVCSLLMISGRGLGSETDTLPDAVLFQKANDAYQAGEYDEALDYYSQIVNNGNKGAILYYNLGNVYFKAGQIAYAILWYERALRLDPSNDDIRHNIAFANQFIVDKIDILPRFILSRWWNGISQSLTSNAWAWISIVLLALFLACMAILLMSRRQKVRRWTFSLGIFLFIAMTFCLVFARKEMVRYTKNPEAVIVQSVVVAKSTPNLSGADLFVVHEGLKVSITDSVADWYEVRLPNGEKGWMEEKSVEII